MATPLDPEHPSNHEPNVRKDSNRGTLKSVSSWSQKQGKCGELLQPGGRHMTSHDHGDTMTKCSVHTIVPLFPISFLVWVSSKYLCLSHSLFSRSSVGILGSAPLIQLFLDLELLSSHCKGPDWLCLLRTDPLHRVGSPWAVPGGSWVLVLG